MNEENKVLENEVEETLETTDLVYDENENLIETTDMPEETGLSVVAKGLIIAAGAAAFIGLKKGVICISNKIKAHRKEMREFKEWKEATNFDRFDENGNVIDESEDEED